MKRHLLSVGVTLLAIGCADVPPEPEPIRPVRVEQVYRSGGSRVRTFSGSARAGAETRLSFRVAGSIRRIPVNVGDAVRAGQTLAELDPRDYELQVEDAQAALAQARARSRNADANLERVRGLYENNNISQNEYDSARAEADASAAQEASLSKRLELARLQLGYTKLVSPVAGAISAVEVEVNENVKVGDPALVLTSGARPEVQVAVPEVFIAQVREGQDVDVVFDARPGEVFVATVTEVGVAATGMATTYPVTVRLRDASSSVRPGMAAEVAITFGSGDSRERMLVPPFAVGEDRGGRFVYVAEPGESGFGVARRREVQVGDLTSEGFEITGGLREGELLITAGVSRIDDGMQVRIP